MKHQWNIFKSFMKTPSRHPWNFLLKHSCNFQHPWNIHQTPMKHSSNILEMCLRTPWNFLIAILNKTWSSVSKSSLSKTFALALVLLVLLVTWIVYASKRDVKRNFWRDIIYELGPWLAKTVKQYYGWNFVWLLGPIRGLVHRLCPSRNFAWHLSFNPTWNSWVIYS